MSMAVDKTKTWRKVEERLAAEPSARKRAILANVLAHMKAEAVPDLEGLMTTLAPDPQYHFWGPTGDVGPKGTEAVRSFYTSFANSGAHRLEYDVERLVGRPLRRRGRRAPAVARDQQAAEDRVDR